MQCQSGAAYWSPRDFFRAASRRSLLSPLSWEESDGYTTLVECLLSKWVSAEVFCGTHTIQCSYIAGHRIFEILIYFIKNIVNTQQNIANTLIEADSILLIIYFLKMPYLDSHTFINYNLAEAARMFWKLAILTGVYFLR